VKIDVMYDRDYNNIEEQTKELRKKFIYETAEKQNYKIEKEYLDYDVNEKGSKLKELMKDIEDGKIKTLIVRSMDRLSRNLMEALSIIDSIEKNGGQCLFIDRGLQKLSVFENGMMNIAMEKYNKELTINKKYKTEEQILDESRFDIDLKDKPIKIGNLLNHKNRGNIITEENDVLGFSFDDFSKEQLSVNVIPKRLEKDDEEYLNIIVEFEKEKDKEFFVDRILQEDFAEDDEIEM